MLAIARVDYSRFRELRVGLYTAMISTILLVLVVGGATRGTRRWIEFPFFTFQPSELGKVLLVACAGRFRDRPPAADVRTPANRAPAPAGAGAGGADLPAARPRHRNGVRRDHAGGSLHRRGQVEAFRRGRSNRARGRHARARDRPRRGASGAEGLSAGAPDLVPQPERGPTRFQLSGQPGLDRRRLRWKDRPRRRGHASAERFSAGAPHGLHLCRGRRALRLRRRCVSTVPLRPAHLEGAATS